MPAQQTGSRTAPGSAPRTDDRSHNSQHTYTRRVTNGLRVEVIPVLDSCARVDVMARSTMPVSFLSQQRTRYTGTPDHSRGC
jgi:hypothetical protein